MSCKSYWKSTESENIDRGVSDASDASVYTYLKCASELEQVPLASGRNSEAS